jgi:zinc transport system substrate-binding protein
MQSIRHSRPRTAPTLLAAVAIFAVLATQTACSKSSDSGQSSTSTPSRLKVAASFYPVAEAVERVGGDCVEVTNLTKPGGGPHDLELTPKQVNSLSEDNMVFYLSKGFQPQVEAAVKGLPGSVTSVDLLAGMPLETVQQQLDGTQGEQDGEVLEGDFDPHVWVDPALQLKMAEKVHDALVSADPKCKTTFDSGLAAYKAQLTQLDSDITAGLTNCQSNVIVTTHRAFYYFADRFGLVQIPIAGLSPDAEPDPKTLEAVAKAAKANNVKVIFFEDAVPPDLAETVAREIGASTDSLSPVETIDDEGLAAGDDYSSVMRANLESLRAGLGCS